MRTVLSIWVVILLTILYIWPAAAQEGGRQIILTENGDYYGFDLLTEKDVSADQCKASCLENPACRAFTYNISARFCFLKSDFGELKTFTGAIAGRVAVVGNEADLGAPPRLEFVPENLHTSAHKFRKTIAGNTTLPTHIGFATLVSTARQNLSARQFKVTIANLTAALKINPEDVSVWLKLSDAARLYGFDRPSQATSMNNTTMSAALNGYLHARTASMRAAALARVARALATQLQYRPALTAYKQSLALNELPAEREAFVKLRRIHGFRVLNHTVDSESRAPRICIQFSEKLGKASVGYESYLSVDGTPPQAVDVKAKQICVEGLDHGGRYKISLRQGLPSAIDEKLLANVTLDIYIRDRKPAARFTGSNFVLPSAARRGIPLVTVNADKANLKLYRVGERALAPLLRGSQFLQQLNTYEVDYLANDLGEPVWTGSVRVRSELNKEVVTSIPVDEALGERKPGVYLLTAQPPASHPDAEENPASQWFVISDIGLTTFNGSAKLNVFARSLASAKPLANVQVALLARNNEVLGTATTDAQGRAELDAGLTRGTGGLAPAVITARSAGADFVFLDVAKPGLDFSDRGVAGRAVPKGIDVYTWTERGIYRAGETVHVAALARDASARAIQDLPLTFVFKRPDGVEDRRVVGKGAALGGYAVELPLTRNAKRGTWQVQVYADPKQEPVTSQRFLVQDFLPERTDFTLAPAQDTIAVAQMLPVKVEGRYLYGAPAGGLSLEGELVVRTKRERTGYSGYLFGLASEADGATQRFPLQSIAPLNASGETTFDIRLGDTKATTRPRTADLVVRMRETSGRSVERKTAIDITPQDTMIGIRPHFEGGQIGENSMSGFDLIAVEPDGGTTTLQNARWSLVKIERNYQWYRSASYWRFEAIDLEKKIADGVVDIGADAASKLSVPVAWGRYRLEVESASTDGPVTSVIFNAGWFVQTRSTETPDGLEIGLDKPSYKAGDIAKLKVSPRFAGEMLIAIATDRILETRSVSVPAEGATIDIPVGEDWGAGAYILATLYRPGDAGASRMPQRAIGVKWLAVDPQERALMITLSAPNQARPHQLFTIPVKVLGLRPDEEAYVTVAAVDVGILNLTNYKSPDPVARYFGQRKLGVSMHDIYGKLIDGSLGQTGRLRSGGDSFDEMSSSGNPPAQKLVAFFSGPVRLDANGEAEVSFDIPQFNGTARIMATAWTAEGIGAAEVESIIRDPVVISASLPKFMAPGDTARLLVEVADTDAPEGAYSIDFETSENISLSTEQVADTLDLIPGKQASLNIPVVAKSAGTGWVRINLAGAGGLSLSHEITMHVRPGLLPVTRKYQVSLQKNGGSLTVDQNLLADSAMDGAKINISVARPSAFDVPSLLLQLDRYPYGCTEQIISKALPLLYAGDFSSGFPGLETGTIREKVQTAISTVLSNQSSAGGFSLWGTQSDDLWLSAYVTDFLTRAAEKGYKVPKEPMKQALRSLQNTLAYFNNLDDNDAAIAYALYVLARNRMASAGDLRYYTDARVQSFRTPFARAQLASAMALYGDQQRAERTFRSAFRLAQQTTHQQTQLYTYGSRLRDASAMLALATETRPQPSDTAAMAELVYSLRRADTYTSTQEQAWMLLAARSQSASNKEISLDINGMPHSGAYARRVEGADIAEEPIRIANRFSEDLRATITTLAVPAQPLAAGGNGFTISRAYYRLDGSETTVSEVRQNERFVAVVNVKQTNDVPSRIIITDLLPAGFEIDNPSIVKSADLKSFEWLPETAPAHLEFRDDRFVAAFDRGKGGASDFTVAYTVRAVTPGVYTHPAANVEDMYRPEFSARTATGWMQVKRP